MNEVMHKQIVSGRRGGAQVEFSAGDVVIVVWLSYGRG